MTKVVLASQSKLKKEVVQKFFNEHLPPTVKREFHFIAAPSNINEQPIGYAETIKGAQNRLNNAKKDYKGDYDYFVSIENGIIPITTDNNEEIWLDVGWVLLEEKGGKQYSASSAGVPFPNEFVNQAKKAGFDKNTVGSFLAKAYNCNGTDPHLYLTNHLISRVTMLEQALLIAFGQATRGGSN
jgi:non-canonical (house-cleaning) NTP pyrophosphatase